MATHLSFQVCCLVLVSSLLTVAVSSKINYQGYHGYYVVTFLPETVEQNNWLQEALRKTKLDTWKEPTASLSPVDVMFSPQDQDVLDYLISSGIHWKITIPDVERLTSAALQTANDGSSANDRFYNLTELYGFLDDIGTTCAGDCEVITIGQSFEGRDLKVIKITRPGTDRRAIYVDSGIHAREWLTPAVTRCFVDKLVNDYGSDPEVTELRDLYDWYIQLVVNPDGYDYTWTTILIIHVLTNWKDRMWRKTRAPNARNNCTGTDANRNYEIGWGLDEGSSGDPCSNTYRGTSLRSTPEIAAYTNFALTVNHTVDLAYSFHTFSQILYVPWHWSNDEEPADLDDLNAMADICVSAVNANSNVTYTFGSPTGIFSGSTSDWWKGFAGVKYSYLMEMRDLGTYGFIAPPEEILPTCVENWAGLHAIVLALSSKQS